MTVHDLISVVLSRFYEDQQGFESFGVKLSWLMYVITTRQKLPLDCDDPFLHTLRRLFPEQHAVWNFIDPEKTVLCGSCHGDIPVHDAVYVEAAHVWVHPQPCERKG